MPPIKVALIGLSASATGVGWAAVAHLPYLRKSTKYQIVALCNSSIAAAQAAIKAYDLSPTTKAYGSPADLAADPGVDLVVSSVRVDHHAETLLPAVKAGKAVFCEWPLGSSLTQAEDMAREAREKGVRTLVGLQGRVAPVVVLVKEVVESGKIGKVLSSTAVGAGDGFIGHLPTPANVEYMGRREVGGNFGTILFGHSKFIIFFLIWFLALASPFELVQCLAPSL